MYICSSLVIIMVECKKTANSQLAVFGSIYGHVLACHKEPVKMSSAYLLLNKQQFVKFCFWSTFGYFWLLLATFQYFWLILAAFRYFFNFFPTFFYFLLLFITFGYCWLPFYYLWLLLATFGYFWRHLGYVWHCFVRFGYI